jgi:cysteine desulfurase
MIYFDHNATTPLLPEARQAWLEAAEQFVGNPSSPHRLGARAETALDNARQQLAALIGCEPGQIVWTSGATESSNMVLHHLAQSQDAQAEAWVSAVEHPCVLAAAEHYFPGRCRLIPVDNAGMLQVERLRQELAQTRPGLVAVMAVNNETGVVQPWREVLAFCRSRQAPFFCDAAQWFGKLPARGLGECDFVIGCAHKFGGPRGVGFLKCPDQARFHPLFWGGKQEAGRRAGTENVAGVLSMMAALAVCEGALEAGEMTQRAAWREAFCHWLPDFLPGARVVGHGQHCLWNTVSAVMPAIANQQRWVVKLDRAGLAVSTGSACASGREEPSHVLAAMGLLPAEAGRVLRFSSGWQTTETDWQTLRDGLLAVRQAMLAG